MTGQPFISRKFPTAIRHVVHRYQHLDEVIPLRKEILRLIEETMTETCTYQNTEEDIKEERLKLVIAQFLLLVESLHEQIAQQQTDKPASGVISDGQRPQMRKNRIWIPNDIIKQVCHN